MDFSGFDRREHPRRPLEVDTELHFGRTRVRFGTKTADVGADGIRVRCPVATEEGDRVQAQLNLVSHIKPIACSARVCWSAPSPDGKCEMGLRFVDLTNSDRQALLRFLSLTA